ncbi:hypothetical protein Glove_138g23 [Diversispora epigaea]|uniref:Myb-like domain-containing protein n=1 Tax=Diversispora epigaea TaxID=1348612 RepID=A0A397J0K1_9GLOM|nr:hypothetical protein Glove_138g23 [Diversispora epigaea]
MFRGIKIPFNYPFFLNNIIANNNINNCSFLFSSLIKILKEEKSKFRFLKRLNNNNNNNNNSNFKRTYSSTDKSKDNNKKVQKKSGNSSGSGEIDKNINKESSNNNSSSGNGSSGSSSKEKKGITNHSEDKISKKEYRARLLASLSRTSTGRWVPPFPPPQKIKRKELKELKESGESKESKEKTSGRNKKSKKQSTKKSPKKFNPDKKPKMRWTEEEDNYLLLLTKIHGENWEKLSEILGRPYYNISYRYNWITSKVWTPEETEKLHNALKQFGDGINYKSDDDEKSEEQESWKKIKELFPNRTIQELKNNYLQYGSLNPKSDKPIVNVGMWSKQELKRFEKALDKYANNFREYELDDFNELWINICKEVKTRSERQCRKMYYWQYSRPYDYERIKFHKNK